MTIEVLSKPACVQCTQSKKTLDRKGLAFTEIDIIEDAAAYELATTVLGYMAAPVVILRDETGEIVDSWSGFQPDKINALSN